MLLKLADKDHVFTTFVESVVNKNYAELPLQALCRSSSLPVTPKLKSICDKYIQPEQCHSIRAYTNANRSCPIPRFQVKAAQTRPGPASTSVVRMSTSFLKGFFHCDDDKKRLDDISANQDGKLMVLMIQGILPRRHFPSPQPPPDYSKMKRKKFVSKDGGCFAVKIRLIAACIFIPSKSGIFLQYIAVSDNIFGTAMWKTADGLPFRCRSLGKMLIGLAQHINYNMWKNNNDVYTFGTKESSQFFQNAGFMSSSAQLWPEEVLALSNSCGGDNNFALHASNIVIMFGCEERMQHSTMQDLSNMGQQQQQNDSNDAHAPSNKLLLAADEESVPQLQSDDDNSKTFEKTLSGIASINENSDIENSSSKLDAEEMTFLVAYHQAMETLSYLKLMNGNSKTRDGKKYCYLGGYSVGRSGKPNKFLQLHSHFIEAECGFSEEFKNELKRQKNTWLLIPAKQRLQLNSMGKHLKDPDIYKKYCLATDSHWTHLCWETKKDECPNSNGSTGFFTLINSETNQRLQDVPKYYFEALLEQLNNEGKDCIHLNKLMTNCKNRANRHILIPAGNNVQHDQQRVHTSPSSPSIAVRQVQNQDSCIMASLASALIYFGDVEASEEIERNIANSLKTYRRLQFAADLLRTRKFHYVPRKVSKDFNILLDVFPYPTLCVLLGDDGATNHAITVVGTWIFDGNWEKALPLTQESLNWCCSTDSMSTQFAKVFCGYHFVKRTSGNQCSV